MQESWSCIRVFVRCLLCVILLGRVALGAQRPIVIKLSRGRSVGRSVCRSVCPLHCGKTADRIRMPFGIVGRTGPGTRQVVWFGDRSTGRGTLGATLGRAIVYRNLLGVRVPQRRDAALLPNYFGQTCFGYFSFLDAVATFVVKVVSQGQTS